MTDHIKQAPLSTTSFLDVNAAEKTYEDLLAKGYTEKDIHVMMSDETRKKLAGQHVKLEHGNKSLEGAGVGGMVGGAVGATLVGLMAAAAAVTLPGIGLVVAGPLAGALAGAATGAAAGGLVGALVGAGIPEDRAKVYEKEMKDGAIVFAVHPRHDADARYFDQHWPTEKNPAN